MKSAKKNWLSRLFKPFRNSSKKSGYKPQQLRMELLEERAMLNVAPVLSLDATTYNITSDSPWYIPLTSTDADGDAVFYKVEVLNGDLTCDLSVGTAWKAGMSTAQKQAYFNTRNPYWELTVYQEGNNVLNGQNSTMLFELFADKAPNTVDHILSLTKTNVFFSEDYSEKFYQNSIFHRVIQGFMSQAGGYDVHGNYRGSLVSAIPDEFNNDLQMNSSGVLAMANTGYKDTGSSQFFVTSERCNWLNFKHSVFGFLVDGQEVQAEVNKQGTNANSTPSPDVIIINAQQVINYTNSTLTIRGNANAGESSTATIRVTPYDEFGLAGQSQLISVNIVYENQTPVFYPIEGSYISGVQGSNITRTIQAGCANGQKLGYFAELNKRDSNNEPELVVNGVSTNYDTGEVTINCANEPAGAYYLTVYAEEYDSSHTSHNILATLNVPIIIYPEVIPDPTNVSLSVADDTGVIGDGITSNYSGLTFTVEGTDSQFLTGLYVLIDNQYEYINFDQTENGATTVDITSQYYDYYGNLTPINYGYGTYTFVAANIWDCTYYISSSDYSGNEEEKHFTLFSNPSPQFNLQILLPTPEGLHASGITSTGFNLDWSPVDEADCYYLEFRKKGTEEWLGGIWDSEETPTACSLPDLDPATIYEVRIYSYLTSNEAAISQPSDIIEVQTLLPSPDGLYADEFTTTGFNLNWNAVENADSYLVEYRVYGDQEWLSFVWSDEASPTMCSISDLVPATVYEVQVSAMSSADEALTSLPSGTINVQTNLPSPEGLYADGIGATEFNLNWNAVENISQYYIEIRAKDNQEWSGDLFTSYSTDLVSCSLNSLAPNTVYEVRVYAYNPTVSSLSLPSETIEVCTLDKLSAPTNVLAEITGKTVSVSWDLVENATSYSVYYRDLESEQWNVGVENITAPTCQFNLSESENASIYKVAVMALTDDPNYEASDAKVVLANAGDTPIMTATLTTWNDRNDSQIPTSVNEWEFLNLQLTANPDDVVNNGGITIVFQYDATLVKPDWANSEFFGIEYSYYSEPLDESGTTREVTFNSYVLDSTAIADGLIANIKMIPVTPSDFPGQAGVVLADGSRDLTITAFTDENKTLAEANVINTPVWAVPYDLDDSGAVDVQDFISFATYYGYVPDPEVKDTMYYCDFNQSGTVDVQDFILFATYYGRSYAKNGANISIPAQTNADAVNAQGAAPVAVSVAAPAQSEESSQTVVTTILVEPIHDCVLTPVSSSNNIASAVYYADVIQASNASDSLSNQAKQENNSDATDNCTSVYNENTSTSLPSETNPLNPSNVDLFFDLELFNDDENDDLDTEFGDQLLPSLRNQNNPLI